MMNCYGGFYSKTAKLSNYNRDPMVDKAKKYLISGPLELKESQNFAGLSSIRSSLKSTNLKLRKLKNFLSIPKQIGGDRKRKWVSGHCSTIS